MRVMQSSGSCLNDFLQAAIKVENIKTEFSDYEDDLEDNLKDYVPEEDPEEMEDEVVKKEETEEEESEHICTVILGEKWQY